MDRYLIHLEHDPEPLACAQVVETFLRTGSHYLARADWGCADGDHASWMIVEAADREEARRIVPTPFRSRARVVRLVKFTLETLAEAMRCHERGPAGFRENAASRP